MCDNFRADILGTSGTAGVRAGTDEGGRHSGWDQSCGSPARRGRYHRQYQTKQGGCHQDLQVGIFTIFLKVHIIKGQSHLSLFRIVTLIIFGNLKLRFLCRNGTVERELFSLDSLDQIRGILAIRDFLVVLQRNGSVYEMDLVTGRLFYTYRVNVGQLYHTGSLISDQSQIPDTDLLLLADYDRGEVFTYRLSTLEKKIRVRNLRNPTSVSYFISNNTIGYIVCESHTHMIKLYDSQWRPLRSFGGFGQGNGRFNTPQSAVQTPAGTIIVADCYNHRVSEFSLSGSFIRQVVTRDRDGVDFPAALSTSFPHMWLVYGRRPFKLKRFRIYA